MICLKAHKSHSTLLLARFAVCIVLNFDLCMHAQDHCFNALQEIKEVAEKRRHSDEGQGVLTLSVAAPYVTRVAAELTYDYKDRYCPLLPPSPRPLSPLPSFPLFVHSAQHAPLPTRTD